MTLRAPDVSWEMERISRIRNYTLGDISEQRAAGSHPISSHLYSSPMRLFRKKQKQEHKILQQIERTGDLMQPGYHRATPECPHPERWSMYDSMTAEAEGLEFLRTLVTTVKPELVVETGAFLGVSTLWIAEGLKMNGRGRIVSCELDPVVFANAKEKVAASELSPLIDLRQESSLEMKVDGTIDLFFSDSDPPVREQ